MKRRCNRSLLSAKFSMTLICWAITTALVACAPVGPDYQPPKPTLPVAWSSSDANGDDPPGKTDLEHWWSLFNDPWLDSLIKRAVTANPDVLIAGARIVQARAQYRLASANALPAANVSGSYSNTRRSDNVSGSGAGTSQDLFQAGFDAGWEIDFFGGLRRAAEAAGARLAAAGENSNDILISLEAEVARNYFELRGSQQRVVTARENITAQKKTLELARGRWQSGLGNQLDVAQAETQLALTLAQLPPLEYSTGQAIYRLSLLLGLPPLDLSEELSEVVPMPDLPSRLPKTLPSDLLRRRPDIRRAERQLAAATADIGVATAELFPRFSLTGLAGLQSTNLSDLLSSSSRYWTVGPTVRWSLFDGGRTRAYIDLNQGLREEAQATYEKTVLTALNEVETTLLSLALEEKTKTTLSQAVTSGHQAVEFAVGRYRAGLAGFLDVLQGERALYQSRDQQVQSEQRLAMNLVALFKALGGGWAIGPDETETSNEPEMKTASPPQQTPSGDIVQ